MKAEAWFIHAGDGARKGTKATLERESFELPALRDDMVLAEPLYGCWEGNMSHALSRSPVDVCRERNEPRVVLGNAGVVRILEIGKNVRNVAPGDCAVIFCVGEEDSLGYPKKIFAYDAVGSIGCLATKTVLKERQVIPIPPDTRYSLPQWAAFSLRYITAWSNWNVAHGTLRLQVPVDEMPVINVWGWGGGVSLATLDLARLFGAQSVMLSGSDKHIAAIAKTRVQVVDHRQFGDLSFDADRYQKDPAYRDTYKIAEAALVEEVARRTKGKMVQIFADYIGTPVYRATLSALSRQGVITTAGWKEGMEIKLLRAKECILRHQHVHTHYARYEEGCRAVAFAEGTGWLPTIDDRIYDFDEVPFLAADYEAGVTSYFPMYAVNRT